MNKHALVLLMAGVVAGQTAFAACNVNDADYAASSQGWVLQKSTGLIWQPCLHGMTFENGSCTGFPTQQNWYDALQTAQGNTDFQSSEWRLPNVKELASLLEFSCGTRINESAFPGQPTNSTLWSNTPVVQTPSTDYSNHVMTARFFDEVIPPNNRRYEHFVTGLTPTTLANFRLVRDATTEDYLQLASE